MPSVMKLTLASALAALSLAAPAPLAETKAEFTIQQKANPKHVAYGPAALYKALNKFGAHERASGVKSAVEAATSGSVTATPVDAYDSEYLCPVTVGTTTTQTFQLDFDTGSSDLWILGSRLKNGGYAPSSSKQKTGYKWSISYGDGSSAGGTVFTDTVKIGGVTVTSQAVEEATSASSEFTSGADDGLVGLAFDNINTVTPTAQKTFFSNAITQGLPKAVMGVNLKYHAAGTYDFGFINTARYTGAITYTPVSSSQGFWMFTPSGYAVGSGATKTGSLAGIADTGTTLILAADAVVSAYYAQVSGARYNSAQGGYTFACSATLPSFALVINGYKAVVPGKFMNYAPIDNTGTTCFGGIQSDSGIGFAIYGDVFLKSQYVLFDRSTSTPRLGFAAQA